LFSCDITHYGTVVIIPDTASVFALTAVEKLQLVEDLWNDISSRPDDVPVHPWQLEEIEWRRVALAARPEAALSWDEMTVRLRDLHRGG
jgi:putative addiction module component (TIGR02574 family)